jgi:hypothetical protein
MMYGFVIFTVKEERKGSEKCGFIDPDFFE